MTLFGHLAFLPDGSSYIADQDIVKKIVESCRGFPLALKVVRKSLCGQPAEAWESRLLKWYSNSSGLLLIVVPSDGFHASQMLNKVLWSLFFLLRTWKAIYKYE